MIAYFFLGICLLAAFLLAGRWFVTADPRVLARALRYLGAGVLGLIALGLLLTGRVGLAVLPALAAIYIIRGGLVPRTMRWPGGGGAAGGGPSGGGGARTSEVETAWLRMSLVHATGEMRGEVRRGAYAGRELASMSREELLSLLEECRREDPESAQLLETWLDRIQGADWRGADTGDAGGGDSEGEARSGGPMSEREAREVLGVSESAGAEEIRAAYHRMMMKYHPDRGGSAYLAAKINQAKDILLGA